jgi:hypothetical protein
MISDVPGNTVYPPREQNHTDCKGDLKYDEHEYKKYGKERNDPEPLL